MAIKGLAVPVFGNYHYNGLSVVYTDGFVAGAAIEYGIEVETSDNNPLHGDNRIIENDYGTFNTGTLTLNTSDLDQETSIRLLGLKEVKINVGEKEVTELVTDDDMKQTPKGFGIIETHQINDVDRYRAVILCKTTMAIPAEAATTKGESIEWQTKEIEGTITRSDENTENYKHPWKREAWFDTEKEAMEYLKTILNVLERVEAVSSEETSVGKTRLIITNRTEGATYKYNKEQASKYKQDLSKWTEFPEDGEIEAETGTVIYLAKTDLTGKAIGAGEVTAVTKEV